MKKLFYVSPFLLFLICAFHPFSAESGGLKKKIRKKLTPNIRQHDLEPRSGPSIHDDYAKAKSHHPTKSSIVTEGNAYQQCRATLMPSFINNSMGWGPAQFRPSGIKGKLSGKIDAGISAYRAFKSLSPPSVIVTAAGNDYPKPIEKMQVKAAKDYNMILVGSLHPSGHRSRFSQEGEAVTIMAPSDDLITSATSTGKYRKFGGTSGATPLVTGSLAGFEWLAGYHPTAEEAKILLAKTAIPTLYSKDKPRKNGAGMVNAYKLAMVGKQLKQTCGTNISCFKDLIQKNDIYNFPEDPALDDEINRAFPECGTTCLAEDLKNPSASCMNKSEVFKKLRKQAFLNPHNKELWKKIACVYMKAGLTANANGALTTYRALSSDTVNRSPEYCKTDADCTLVPACRKPVAPSSPAGGGTTGGGVKNTIPASPADKDFIPLNKTQAEIYYVVDCRGELPLCNGKCRCDQKEDITSEKIISYPKKKGSNEAPRPSERRIETRTYYSVACVESQCRMMISKGIGMTPVEKNKEPSAGEEGDYSVPATPSTGGGAIQ